MGPSVGGLADTGINLRNQFKLLFIPLASVFLKHQTGIPEGPVTFKGVPHWMEGRQQGRYPWTARGVPPTVTAVRVPDLFLPCSG